MRLADHNAVTNLEAAVRELETSPHSAIRAQLDMYADLAFAYATAGDSKGALNYAAKARQLASRIGSDRQRQRLAKLQLPEIGGPALREAK